jgi:protein-S-isoprenylcysteine O-methyltransferase Ste14
MVPLQTRAYVSLAALALGLAAVLFVPAGSIKWWNAWVYLMLFVGLSAVITADLLRRDPALLERRMKGGPTAERRPQQRAIMVGASIGFIALLLVPALDFRFGWTRVSVWIVLLGQLMFVTGFAFVGRVYQENTYTAATIQVEKGQRVISTGPYALVRHPMYASALIYIVGTPLALGSYVGLLAVAFMAPFLVWRLLDEERMLARELPGYTDYQGRVRYRLIPYVW